MNKLKYSLILITLLGIISAQNSSITIVGTGTSSTSAHLTLQSGTYLCPNDYVIQNGATLTKWGTKAICGCVNGSIIYNTATGKFNFCEDGIWVEK